MSTIIGLNSIGDDAWFIKLTDQENYFIHFEGEDKVGENVVYAPKPGPEGAAIFKKGTGLRFIRESKYDNLTLVKVKDVLPNDGSLN